LSKVGKGMKLGGEEAGKIEGKEAGKLGGKKA
jgi:hypothetical protein